MLIIYGAGGHARVVANTASLAGFTLACFCDDTILSNKINSVSVVHYDAYNNTQSKLVIGIGNNNIRKSISQRVRHGFATIIHPSASIADNVSIGEGTVILANAIIQTGAIIGKHVIINAGVCVDHDATIEDFVHVYPNAYIGGEAVIKAMTNIEACKAVPRQAIIECNTFI